MKIQYIVSAQRFIDAAQNTVNYQKNRHHDTAFGMNWDDGDVIIDDEPVAAINTPEALYDFLCQFYAEKVAEDIE